jgi:hypothetical protein
MNEKYNAHVETNRPEAKIVEGVGEVSPAERFTALLSEKMGEIARLRRSHVEHPTQGFAEDAEELSNELHHELSILLGETPDVDGNQSKLVPE